MWRFRHSSDDIMNTDDDTPIPRRRRRRRRRRRADRERWLFIGGGIAGVIVIAALSFGLGRLRSGGSSSRRCRIAPRVQAISPIPLSRF